MKTHMYCGGKFLKSLSKTVGSYDITNQMILIKDCQGDLIRGRRDTIKKISRCSEAGDKIDENEMPMLSIFSEYFFDINTNIRVSITIKKA